MASRDFNRNLLSLDEKLCILQAVADFATAGSPFLQQWVPSEVGSSVGAYQDAPMGGCEGVVGIFKRGTGDFRVVLQDSYVRSKAVIPTYENSAHLGIAAPYVEPVAGSIADLYPDCTSFSVERLEAGHSGLAVDSVQPTFTISGAGWPPTVIGFTLVDSAGSVFTVLGTDGDALIVSGTATPATGTSWSLRAGGANGSVVLNGSVVSGTPTVTPFVPATFTVSGAIWLVNRWKGHYLRDYAGNLLEIASNTATVLALVGVAESLSVVFDGTTGTTTGSVFTITAGGAIVSANALVGKVFSDGTNVFYITANSALTATTGTITVVGTPAGTVTATGSVSDRPQGAVSGPYVIEQGFPLANTYPVTGPQITGSANTGTGSANTWTPATHVNWATGIFANMFLIDGAGVYWTITENSTTALTVSSNGSNTTPTTGATWSIVSVAGGASIEVTTGALSGSGSALTFTGTPHTLAGTNSAPAFTGAAEKVVNNTPAFSGTGFAAVGQVITTTDNQTMTLNQCAGMLFMSISGDVCEIVSNTAVTGAPAVLTVVGKATTDAGVYSIFTGPTPTGTVAAPTFTGESYTPAGTVAGTLTATVTATNPASGERLLLAILLSDGTVME